MSARSCLQTISNMTQLEWGHECRWHFTHLDIHIQPDRSHGVKWRASGLWAEGASWMRRGESSRILSPVRSALIYAFGQHYYYVCTNQTEMCRKMPAGTSALMAATQSWDVWLLLNVSCDRRCLCISDLRHPPTLSSSFVCFWLSFSCVWAHFLSVWLNSLLQVFLLHDKSAAKFRALFSRVVRD